MELVKELGSRSWINGSGKKDSRKFGLFICPVCGIEVEKSLSHGKRDKNCGSKECRKATFVRNPNMVQATKENGLAKKSQYKYGNEKYWRNFYKVYIAMISRCTNPNDPAYEKYGGRGIAVSEEWMDIENFSEDMFPIYSELMSNHNGIAKLKPTLDRKNVNLGYSKENCEWITLSNNVSKDKKIPVVMLDINDNILMSFDSLTDTANIEVVIGSVKKFVSPECVRRCCNGNQELHLGYRWAFATNKTSIQNDNIYA